MTGQTRPRRQTRRDMVLAAAVELFRERGYAEAGVDEIGAAAGITGPGVYRHFASKGALLVAVFDRVLDDLIAGAAEAHTGADAPLDVLDRLILGHSRFAARNRGLVAVYQSEERALPDDERRRLRRRQADYLHHWEETLSTLDDRNPHMTVDPHLAVVSAIAVIHNLAGTRRPVSEATLENTMVRLARAVILA